MQVSMVHYHAPQQKQKSIDRLKYDECMFYVRNTRYW